MVEHSGLAGRSAAAVLCLLLLAGCGSPEATDDGASPAGASASPVVADGTGSSASPGAAETREPLRKASAKGWKVYTDPDRVLSFEVPGDWVVQRQVKPSEPADGGVHLDVRDSDGKLAAELHTRLKLPKDKCTPGEVREYAVVFSEPADVPAVPGGDRIEPVFAFRTILGYKYFGSFGLTDKEAGIGNQACTIENTVTGPKPVGTYSFSNAARHGTPPADGDFGALETFDLIAQAEKFTDSKRFKTVKQVITSLQISAAGNG
ncbi:hypothetical protein D477_006738 [Arthrobacter crystallopoietes BAB-32]|uniref:Lipoprotein n=1 Tax=Arthrobacter crystallopoietes BAB-32 TaxID=1246476 RepID=N1UX49_9MICC|nr:hypothetical protein [Arthrobacter crystallopoietes]EMY34976.1 hypothetical protein D477_006738 [Arthrobacter crystallopoietes BAB-32]